MAETKEQTDVEKTVRARLATMQYEAEVDVLFDRMLAAGIELEMAAALYIRRALTAVNTERGSEHVQRVIVGLAKELMADVLASATARAKDADKGSDKAKAADKGATDDKVEEVTLAMPLEFFRDGPHGFVPQYVKDDDRPPSDIMEYLRDCVFRYIEDGNDIKRIKGVVVISKDRGLPVSLFLDEHRNAFAAAMYCAGCNGWHVKTFEGADVRPFTPEGSIPPRAMFH